MGASFLNPSDDTWWACDSGLIPCVITQVLDQAKDFWVLVQLISRIIYHSDEKVFYQLEISPRRTKKEAIMAVLVYFLLGISLVEAIATGTSALVLQDQNYRALQMAIDADIAT